MKPIPPPLKIVHSEEKGSAIDNRVSPAFVSVDDLKGRRMFPSGRLIKKKREREKINLEEFVNFYRNAVCTKFIQNRTIFGQEIKNKKKIFLTSRRLSRFYDF